MFWRRWILLTWSDTLTSPLVPAWGDRCWFVKNKVLSCQMQTEQRAISILPAASKQRGLWQVPASRAAWWWREQLTHCSQQKPLHLSSLCFAARCGTIQKLGLNLTSAPHHNYSNGSAGSLLLANAAVWSTGCLCHCGVIIGALAKPLSLSIAVGSLLKRAVFLSLLCFSLWLWIEPE